MRSDTLRQVATVAAFLMVMVSNIAANALPIGGMPTKAIRVRLRSSSAESNSRHSARSGSTVPLAGSTTAT